MNQTKATDNSENPTRRALVREGVRLAFVAPIISTFFAREVYAANYSCYLAGHACGGARPESCCTGLACVSGTCQ